MTKSGFISLGALALVAAVHAPLAAQGSSQVQLAFGYECGDRFLVRNEGNTPVTLEYAVAGSQDKSTLHLNARQQAEIATAQNGNLELWVGGKVVASEPKGNRACGAPQNNGNNGGVSVRPLDPNAQTTAQQSDTEYSQPAVVVVAPRAYDYYDWYYPYGYYPYGYYGYSPYYYPSVGIYSRGGFGGGIGGGAGGRGRGRR
jgi:hypothetical protein